MPQVKAIETRYKGCRFRSRLEARWAVFFDTLGVDWEYEKEGFELPSGKYLPDFWVPYPFGNGWGFWIEIKPVEFSTHEEQLLAELTEHTGHRAYGIAGNPWRTGHSIAVFQHHHNGPPENIPLLRGHLVELPVVAEYDVMVESHAWEEWKEDGKRRRRRFPFVTDFDGDGHDLGRLDAAFDAARSARFEFGESGSR